MTTQTGSISFESTGGLKSYAKQNYATLSQIKGQFATCGTGASTAAKVATIVPADSNWELYEGATITVKFSSTNSTTTPTLNVNGTGAKQIRDYNGQELTKAAREWGEGAAIALTYDGTYWRIQDSNLMERVHTAESNIKQTATSITSLVSMNDNYTQPDGTTATNNLKSYINQTTGDITQTISNTYATKNELSNVETSVSQTADSITSLAAANATYTTPDGTTQTNQTAAKLELKANKATLTSEINASADTVKINADRIEINGSTTFKNGNTTTTLGSYLDGAYDPIGAADTVGTIITQTRSWYAECTTAAATTAKAAIISPVTTEFNENVLTPGTIVLVKFTNTNDADVANLTLSVNGTTAKNIKYIYNGSYNNIPGKNYLKGGQMYTFTYDGTYWIVEMNYNTNTTYNLGNNQVYNNLKVKGNIAAESIAVGNADGYIKAAAGVKFDLSYQIIWVTKALTTSSTGTDLYAYNYSSIYDRNLATNHGFSGGTAGSVVYLVGTVNGNEITLADTYLTTTPPVNETNPITIYIPIGKLGLQSTGANYFYFECLSTPVLYAYLDRKFRQVTPTEVISEQYIYKQAVSGTNTMSEYNTWVTSTAECVTGTPPNAATGQTPVWSTKRPTYQTNYPVIFVAKQIKRLDSTVTCTTPVKDDSMTIIDGGHITTGTIDASKVVVDKINAAKITSGYINADRIESGSISVGKIDATSGTFNTANIPNLDAAKITSGYINADRIEGGSIGVNKIDATSGTFNTANIPNLSAAKITSGDIAADRIKANAVSAINATANTIDAKNINVSSINIGDLAGEIGGRNLLIGDVCKIGKWIVNAPSGANFTKTELDNGYGVTIGFDSAGGYEVLNAASPLTVETGETYTLSCKYSVGKAYTRSYSDRAYGISVRTDSGTHGSYDTDSNCIAVCPLPIGIEEGKSSVTFEATTATVYLCMNGGMIKDGTTGLSFTVRELKLERGNKATDWTPAPEDLTSELAAQQPFIVGTQTAATRFWTGTCSELTELKTGQKIIYWLPYAYKSETAQSKGITAAELVPTETITIASSNDWLKLTLADGTDTGWIPIYFQGTTRLTSHYGAGSSIILVYREGYSSSIPKGWWGMSQYNTNDVDRHRINNTVKIGNENISQYCIAGRSDSGHKKLAGNLEIDLTYPIAYLSAGNISGQNYAVAANGTATAFYDAMPTVNLQYTKPSWTGTQYAMCYIKGTLSGQMFTVHSDIFTTTIPILDDGFVYIPIGMMASTYQVNFNCNNTIYGFRNGSFHKLDTVSNYIEADSEGIKIFDSQTSKEAGNYQLQTSNTTAFYIDGVKRSQVSGFGFDVYDGSGIQKFSAGLGNTIIGSEDDAHTIIKSDEISMILTGNQTALTIKERDIKSSKTTDVLIQRDSAVLKADIRQAQSFYFTWTYLPTNYSDLGITKAKILITRKSNKNGSVRNIIEKYIDLTTQNDTEYSCAWTELNGGGHAIKFIFHNPSPQNLPADAVRVEVIDLGNVSAFIDDSTSPAGIYSYTLSVRGYYGTKTISFGTPIYLFGELFDTTNFGAYAFSQGFNTFANGDYSHVEGNNSHSDGSYSHAEGYYTSAYGNYSHAKGHYTYAYGNYSHSEGFRTYVYGDYAHGEGTWTHANGIYSHAEGDYTKARGKCSHTEGQSTCTNGNYSHAEGSYTEANGECSHAEGFHTQANGGQSHAEGRHTCANGGESHAEGYYAEANGLYSHAEGDHTEAVGKAQLVIGTYNTNEITSSTFTGNGTSTYFTLSRTPNNIIKIYIDNVYVDPSTWTYSDSSGTVVFTTAPANNSTIKIYYIISTTHPSNTTDYGDYAFIIGNGTDNDNRHNALAVNWNGNLELCSRLYRKSNTVIDSTATVSSSQLITGMYEQDGNGQQVGYSEIYRTTSNDVYRSFAVTNKKSNLTSALYLHSTDGGIRYFSSNIPNRVLWSGALFMTSGHQPSFSGAVSDQLNGIVLCWSAYVDGSAKNYDWVYTFIPKHHTANHGSTGVGTVLATADFGAVGMKYVYVYNDHLVGNDKNDDTGTANGITYRNNYWVLRYVLGV